MSARKDGVGKVAFVEDDPRIRKLVQITAGLREQVAKFLDR